MNLFAVETSTELCSVALLRGGELFVEEVLAGNRHAELLTGLVQRLFSRARLTPGDMDAFAFGQGPGAFTGLRIACGLVQGLAAGAGKPVIPVPSLMCLAEQSNEGRVVCAFDARMGEAYLAAYSRTGRDWDEIVAPRLVGAGGVPSLPGRGWVASGSGFTQHAWLRDAYREAIEMRLEGDLPRAGAVARIAARKIARGEAIPPERAAPLYLRDKVALTTEERRTKT